MTSIARRRHMQDCFSRSLFASPLKFSRQRWNVILQTKLQSQSESFVREGRLSTPKRNEELILIRHASLLQLTKELAHQRSLREFTPSSLSLPFLCVGVSARACILISSQAGVPHASGFPLQGSRFPVCVARARKAALSLFIMTARLSMPFEQTHRKAELNLSS